MLKLLVVALVGMIAAPASAQSVRSDPVRSGDIGEDIVRSLPHPYDVEDAGGKIGAAVGAILDVPIGGVVQAIDPAARVDPRETLGDVAGRGDPDFEGRMKDEVAGLSVKAADMVRGLAAAGPVLGRSLAQLERDLERALGGLGR